jgi:hypothetical protein
MDKPFAHPDFAGELLEPGGFVGIRLAPNAAGPHQDDIGGQRGQRPHCDVEPLPGVREPDYHRHSPTCQPEPLVDFSSGPGRRGEREHRVGSEQHPYGRYSNPHRPVAEFRSVDDDGCALCHRCARGARRRAPVEPLEKTDVEPFHRPRDQVPAGRPFPDGVGRFVDDGDDRPTDRVEEEWEHIFATATDVVPKSRVILDEDGVVIVRLSCQPSHPGMPPQ